MNVAGTDGEHVYLHRTSKGMPVFVAQLDFGVVFIKCKVARDTEEVKDIEFKVASGAGELTQTAVHIQTDVAVGSGGDIKLACGVVNHHVLGGPYSGNTAVDLYIQIGGAQGNAFNTDQSH